MEPNDPSLGITPVYLLTSSAIFLSLSLVPRSAKVTRPGLSGQIFSESRDTGGKPLGARLLSRVWSVQLPCFPCRVEATWGRDWGSGCKEDRREPLDWAIAAVIFECSLACSRKFKLSRLGDVLAFGEELEPKPKPGRSVSQSECDWPWSYHGMMVSISVLDVEHVKQRCTLQKTR